MVLLQTLVRVISFVLLVALALAGLAAAVFAVVGLTQLADLAALSSFRDTVGGFLRAIEADGPTARVAALAGLGGLLLGLLLLAGILIPRRERLVTLERSPEGTLAARRRPLGQVAGALAEQTRGVTEAQAKVRPRRRGGGGTVRLTAVRTRPTDAKQVKDAVGEQLRSLTGPFALKAKVAVRAPDGRRSRVQ